MSTTSTMSKVDTAETNKKTSANVKNKILIIVAVLIMVGLGIWYGYYWEGTHYFTTENSKVTAEVYSVTAPAAGKLVKYTVHEGSIVKENEVIGRVENGPFIKSPIDGQVVKTDVTLNQMVAPTTVIAVISDTENIHIGANVEETDITKIKEGQYVSVQLDAYPGKKFNAHVSEIDLTTQNALSGNAMSYSTSGTYTKVTQLIPIKIHIDDDVNLDGLIGTNATVKIKVK